MANSYQPLSTISICIYIYIHMYTYIYILYIYIYLEPVCCPRFLALNPPKQGFFPIKTRVIWVPGMLYLLVHKALSSASSLLVAARQRHLPSKALRKSKLESTCPVYSCPASKNAVLWRNQLVVTANICNPNNPCILQLLDFYCEYVHINMYIYT